MSLTLEQARMDAAYRATWRYAFETRNGSRVLDGKRAKAWKTHVMGFGTSVQRCGLLQALAFLRRDAPAPVHQGELSIYETVALTLADHLRERGFFMMPRGDDLLEVVRKLSAMDYMLVSREVLGVALWLKRSAQILCNDSPVGAGPAAGGPDA